MEEKGISQVDFAIAAGMFLLLFASLVLFVTNYFYSLRNDAMLAERQAFASSLLSDVFSSGFPQDWESSLQHFTNNTAANWSRSLARSTNATISTFSSNELGSIDGSYAIIDEAGGADALEVTFPELGIPSGASLGNISFRAYYNTTALETEFGEGDYIDDMTFFMPGSEAYLEDWGAGPTAGQFVWWNSSDFTVEIVNSSYADSMSIRLYYNPTGNNLAYFDQINSTVTFSYYPNYPRKIGLSADSYYIEILLNNTIDSFANEKVSVNLSKYAYYDIDPNSVVVYNDSGASVQCSISEKVVSFNANTANNTNQWFRIWFSRNSTSNFSSPACSASIGGDDNLTIENRNETIYPPHSARVIQYRKLAALNSSIYRIMKGVSDIGNDFHITLKDSQGNSVLEYGESLPRKGDINALQRYALYQNSSAGINEGRIIVYVW